MQKLSKIGLLVGVLSIGLAGCASSVTGLPPQTTGDEAISNNVAVAIEHLSMKPAPTVHVITHRAIVTLTGTVYSFRQGDIIIHTTQHVPDVRGVYDNLIVQHYNHSHSHYHYHN